MKNGKRVLITGGSKGIGAQAVRQFSKAGYEVFFTYNKSESAAMDIAQETGAVALKADVSVRCEVDSAIEKAGGVDVLINNAGISQFALFTDITQSDWDRMIAVNLTGAFNCTQAVLPHMIHQKSGRIINISSMWGEVGAACEVHYSAAKAGLIGMTRALAKELGPSGITVNCITPGVIDTEMNSALDKETLDSLAKDTPMGRIGDPEDVVSAMLYLASDSASFITGQILGVSGGFVI